MAASGSALKTGCSSTFLNCLTSAWLRDGVRISKEGVRKGVGRPYMIASLFFVFFPLRNPLSDASGCSPPEGRDPRMSSVKETKPAGIGFFFRGLSTLRASALRISSSLVSLLMCGRPYRLTIMQVLLFLCLFEDACLSLGRYRHKRAVLLHAGFADLLPRFSSAFKRCRPLHYTLDSPFTLQTHR